MKRVVYFGKRMLFLGLLFTFLLAAGCGSGSKMKDGFYTAEMSNFSNGWKEYLCIMVKDGTIVYAEFNGKNPSGYIKAWDNSYMKNMYSFSGTYPNEYTRAYVSQLVSGQSSDSIETVSGASSSGNNFRKLATAVIEQAKKGDTSTVIVESASE